ncbi:hypothetical protein [Lysobacter gummosus]|uniref:hypothetical protein n=1 Tax=Lysobacter gummosus TaxID=262324 RepID=UPI003635AC18
MAWTRIGGCPVYPAPSATLCCGSGARLPARLMRRSVCADTSAGRGATSLNLPRRVQAALSANSSTCA